MDEALGMVETCGLATAVTVADIMVKTADVKLLGVERAKGQGWITVKIMGDVAAVSAAVTAGIAVGETCGDYVASKVIPRPEESIKELFMQPNQSGDWADDFENATLAKLANKENNNGADENLSIDQKETTAVEVSENDDADKAENIDNIEIKPDEEVVSKNEQVVKDVKSRNKSSKKSNKNKSK